MSARLSPEAEWRRAKHRKMRERAQLAFAWLGIVFSVLVAVVIVCTLLWAIFHDRSGPPPVRF